MREIGVSNRQKFIINNLIRRHGIMHMFSNISTVDINASIKKKADIAPELVCELI
ncbi:MAG: hypothetical protein AB8U25_06005 [Rickettsiales endosymbiont of Dermacentor nuttalli]